MTINQISIEAAKTADAEALATLRVAAMRPSLEAAGRFDHARARDRFLSSFSAADTKLIRREGALVGFFVVRKRDDHLYLDHLYVSPGAQGLGVGRYVVDRVKAEARLAKLPIRLMALTGSPANEFYLSCGFAVVAADGLDTSHLWVSDA